MHKNPSFSPAKAAEIELKMTTMKNNLSATEQRAADAESKSQAQMEQQANLMKAYVERFGLCCMY